MFEGALQVSVSAVVLVPGTCCGVEESNTGAPEAVPFTNVVTRNE